MAASLKACSEPTRSLVGYLGVFFLGDAPNVYFYLSNGNNALSFKALNGGQAILDPSSGTGGVRDPSIINGGGSEAGKKWYIIGTDLDIGKTTWDASQRKGSLSIYIWESTDLINWGTERLVKVENDQAGMVWAPDAIWDASKGQYLVHWASKFYPTSDSQHTGTPGASQIRYAYTSDFKTFTSPQTLIAASTPVIDLAILQLPQYGANSYARFLKDESASLVYMERSDDGLFGTWTRPGGASAWIHTQVEGPYAYLDNQVDGKVNLLLDYYGSDGYRPFTSTNLNANAWVDGDRTNFPTYLRHGSVIGINQARYDALNANWGAHAPSDTAAKHPRLTAAEVTALPGYSSVTWELQPTQEGKLKVAEGRGGPLNISWEVHGTGKTKVIAAWQRQTLRFGHEQGDQYSFLIFDNRGIGRSDKPVMRYSTSEMAKDVVELADHLGWTQERELHVIGVSMGGMIAQELGQLIPERICSLSLFSTLARFQRTVPFLQNLRNRVSMFLPKSLDRTIIDVAYNMFPDSWLDAPDTLHLPSSTTPGCLPAAGHTDWESGAYGHFPTNFARIAAQDLEKRSDTDGFGPKGFILQAIAAGWHDMSPERLKELGDKVGRERILVVHGTEDRMLTFPHGEALIKQLEPGQSYCDERRPSCVNCTTSERSCVYLDTGRKPPSLSPASPASSPALSHASRASFVGSPAATSATAVRVNGSFSPLGSSPVSSGPQGQFTPSSISPVIAGSTIGEASPHGASSPVNMLHLELLHHALTEQALYVGASQSYAQIMTDMVIPPALSYPFLMNELLALSALHLATVQPNRRQHLESVAAELQTSALSSFNQSCHQVTPSNCLPMFVFSSFIGNHVFYTTFRFHSDNFHSFLEEFVKYMQLHRGVRSVISNNWQMLRELSAKALMLEDESDLPTRGEPQGNECDSLRHLLETADLSPATRETYMQAVESLQWGFDAQRVRHVVGLAFAWPIQISTEYLDLLKQRRPEALAILAHFAVMLHSHRSAWLIGGAGRYIIESISGYLGTYWENWLAWPVAALAESSTPAE
ncbi:hypothetical protein VF21_06408 [Pseudogymnoascus sp. 05NY08]|nr:hypothetical protein VF21_06408 [Pseudogymnoascus sp. 05NY08]